MGIDHRFQHVIDELKQLVVHFGHGLALLAEDGIAVLDDGSDHEALTEASGRTGERSNPEAAVIR
jgi:hypothetical protein